MDDLDLIQCEDYYVEEIQEQEESVITEDLIYGMERIEA